MKTSLVYKVESEQIAIAFEEAFCTAQSAQRST